MKSQVVLAVALVVSGWGMSHAQEGVLGRIGPSGEFLELEHRVDGHVVKNYLPLHQNGGVRYFSAGVGLEERQAAYPPFALKLVFTAGGKPFVAGVDVTIQPTQGGTVIKIPREQVEGPWLFLDLPVGRYHIAATYADRKQELHNVAVTAGKQQTLYLRWVEDQGRGARIASE